MKIVEAIFEKNDEYTISCSTNSEVLGVIRRVDSLGVLLLDDPDGEQMTRNFYMKRDGDVIPNFGMEFRGSVDLGDELYHVFEGVPASK